MSLPRFLAAPGAVLLLAVAGCSGPESDVPELDDLASQPAESDTTESSGPAATDEADGSGSASSPAAGPVEVETLAEAPDDDAGRAVHDAYVGFWTVDAAVLADPAVPLETLTVLLLDPQRARTTGSIEQQRASGHRSVGVIRVAPVVVTVDGDQATVDDCLDDSGLTAVDADGTAVPDSAGSLTPLRAVLRLVEGRWLVQDLQPRVDADCS